MLNIRHRYNVIHGIEDAGLLAVVLASCGSAKVVFEKHSDPGSYKKSLLMTLYRWVERFTIRHADAIIGTGAGLVEQARKIAPTRPAHHIFDIPSSLVEADEAKVAEATKKLRAVDDEVLITYVGSFAVYQGIDLMFDAIPLVTRKHARARFIIIGGTRKEIDERRSWLVERGAAKLVTFVSKVPPDKLPNYLAASDILLSPRIAGTNTPLKLLDYLKAGRAIVATDNEANRLILDDTNSLLVTPNPEAFAEGISRLVDDECLRSRLAEKGGTLIRDLYNFQEFKRRLAVCYEGL